MQALRSLESLVIITRKRIDLWRSMGEVVSLPAERSDARMVWYPHLPLHLSPPRHAPLNEKKIGGEEGYV